MSGPGASDPMGRKKGQESGLGAARPLPLPLLLDSRGAPGRWGTVGTATPLISTLGHTSYPFCLSLLWSDVYELKTDRPIIFFLYGAR